MKFFLIQSFYQGRNEIRSEIVGKKAIDCLNDYVESAGGNPSTLLDENNFSTVESMLEQVIGKGKIGKRGDIDMITSILNFASKLKQKNIINHSISKIKNSDTSEHFYELQKIYQVGPKISSAYLRDLICMYSQVDEPPKEKSACAYSWEKKHLSKADLTLLQYVDRTIKKTAFKTRIIEDMKEKNKVVKAKIVNACLNSNVSPIKFSQGAFLFMKSRLDH